MRAAAVIAAGLTWHAAYARSAPSAVQLPSDLPCSQANFRIGTEVVNCTAAVTSAKRGPKQAACGDALAQQQVCDALVAKKKATRFAVCFWGLTRSVSDTIGSVRGNMYGALRREGAPFSVFVHTYTASSTWRRDIGLLTNFTEINRWYAPSERPNAAVQVDQQHSFDVQLFASGLRRQLLMWGDGIAGGPHVPVTKRSSAVTANPQFVYLMRGLYSLKRLTALWQHHQTARNEPFKAVLYARPDLVWITPIPPAVIRSFRQHPATATDRVYLPRWLSRVVGPAGSEMKEFAMNDRLSIGTPGAMLRVGNRLDAALQYSESAKRPLHSERQIGWMLAMLSIPSQNPVGSVGGWRVRSSGSDLHGGCLDVGVGVETHPHKYSPVPRMYAAGAYGGRVRPGGAVFVKDHQLINHTYWIHPGDKPACGGARALALLSSQPLRDLVCGKLKRPEWCQCRMEVAALDFWKQPPDDASASFAPKGEWRDVVVGGRQKRKGAHAGPPPQQEPASQPRQASPAGGGGVVAMGSSYGGWNFAPNLLSRGSVVYSIGLGRDMSWEAAMLRAMPFLKIWGFDSTPVHMQWWKKAPLRDHPSVTHVEVLLAGKDGNITLHLPRGHVTSFVPVQDGVKASKTTRVSLMAKTLPTLARENGHSQIDLLKIDVEGAEFAVLDAWSKNKQAYPAVCQLLLELHARLVPGTSNDEIVRVATQELGFVVQHETKNRACPDGCVSLMHPAHCCRTAPANCSGRAA
eukprot:TRINITY_DN13170_c0_g2_i3.p1 TRINITY_DN13170_c0_g2~~TRINITY_DN13170_c0_g2_i3.p1  ORF type:complete len:760 (+),score=228.56 TRINITY_DN13170_c0_g2_i3:44-2281(+)